MIDTSSKCKLAFPFVAIATAICLALLFSVAVLSQPSHSDSAPDQIGVVYPTASTIVEAPASFIVGAIPAGHALSCNGQKVRVNELGFFAHVVSLHHGANHFHLTLDDGSPGRELIINREPALEHISEGRLAIGSIEPSQDIGVKYGDTIAFTVRATPNARVFVRILNRQVELSNAVKSLASKKGALARRGQAVANGETYQRRKDSANDLYNGFYRVAAEDHWLAQPAVVTVIVAGKSTQKPSAGRIWTVAQPSLAETAQAGTIVRLGPGLARTTPLDKGVRLEVDGWVGTQMRCQYTPQQHVFIDRKELVFEGSMPEGKRGESGLPPKAIARTINIRSVEYGQSVRIPLDQRLPYQIEQKLLPNSLTVKIYGVTSDTDWMTAPLSESSTDQGESRQTEAKLIDHVDWKQPADGQYEVVVHLQTSRQWGYKIYYEGTTLCLDVKRPVQLAEGSKKLNGIKICVDPGHGGSEAGAIGCSGIHESEINLAIAVRFKELLENEGANVVMTRTAESQNPTLDERVAIATSSQADFLVSVHNNALPDGGDPWKEHGSSAYWYHPQSIQLAKCLKDGLVHGLGFSDLGARYQNLALVRPTAMPAVLAEVGFMINPDEYAKLIDPSVQSKAAQSLFSGLLSYLKSGAE